MSTFRRSQSSMGKHSTHIIYHGSQIFELVPSALIIFEAVVLSKTI